MNKTVTVDEALSRGHKIVNYPLIVIIIGTMVLSIGLMVMDVIPIWGTFVGFVLAFALAWLWWSFTITWWRLWAFENVRNVHELKQRAIQEQLIWDDNSIFEKTEIRSAKAKNKLKLLQTKFEEEDVFQDDVTVPNETIVYYSKGKNLIEMSVMLICLGIGIYTFITSDNYLVGSILTVVGGFFGYREYKQATNTEPQIILNNKGIQTISAPFYSWASIKNAEVVTEGTGKSTHTYLTYSHPEGEEQLEIDDYDIDERGLNKLLRAYSGRNKQHTTKVDNS